ncbi:hypothetical protein [Microbacterium sp. G2-8]|uniref:hypothetical protein n=1 Tax=Microbacterium sp. G2-8 TaxID=2842454 RepID=UPI001C88E2A2|nr:hypothetical protein [Microbacterium sp. G2-8]
MDASTDRAVVLTMPAHLGRSDERKSVKPEIRRDVPPEVIELVKCLLAQPPHRAIEDLDGIALDVKVAARGRTELVAYRLGHRRQLHRRDGHAVVKGRHPDCAGCPAGSIESVDEIRIIDPDRLAPSAGRDSEFVPAGPHHAAALGVRAEVSLQVENEIHFEKVVSVNRQDDVCAELVPCDSRTDEHLDALIQRRRQLSAHLATRLDVDEVHRQCSVLGPLGTSVADDDRGNAPVRLSRDRLDRELEMPFHERVVTDVRVLRMNDGDHDSERQLRIRRFTRRTTRGTGQAVHPTRWLQDAERAPHRAAGIALQGSKSRKGPAEDACHYRAFQPSSGGVASVDPTTGTGSAQIFAPPGADERRQRTDWANATTASRVM